MKKPKIKIKPMKVSKNTNYTIAQGTTAVQLCEIPNYKRNFRSFFPTHSKKVEDREYNKLAELINEWLIAEPEAINFTTFLNHQRILQESMFQYLKFSPILSETYKIAIQILGSRREVRSFDKNPDGTAFKHLQGTYDPIWKDQEKYFNDMKKEIAAKAVEGYQKVGELIVALTSEVKLGKEVTPERLKEIESGILGNNDK